MVVPEGSPRRDLGETFDVSRALNLSLNPSPVEAQSRPPYHGTTDFLPYNVPGQFSGAPEVKDWDLTPVTVADVLIHFQLWHPRPTTPVGRMVDVDTRVLLPRLT